MTDLQRERIIHELISAQGALNMPPKPIKEQEGQFLSEKDSWAGIAYEHILKAMELLINGEKHDD